MGPIDSVSGGSPATSVPQPFGWLLGRLYNHNPFYVVSAALILFGLNAIFQDRDAAAHPNALSLNSWLQLAVIGGYAVLLAVTGVLIVRVGRVWDDARTILLTLVLLFVAMSVSFDKLVLMGTAAFGQVLSAGLIAAIALSEFVLRGLRIRLPVLFCVPFYLALGLFFLYPVGFVHVLYGVGQTNPKESLARILWAIVLFPCASSLVTITLLPAVWRGPAYVSDNGTPWRWPLFPWSLFVVLAVAVVFRSYYLTVSFHPVPGRTSGFGVYFLVPFIGSVCLIVFEIGRSIHRSLVEAIALIAPLPLLAIPFLSGPHDAAYNQYLHLVMGRIGSPVFISWCAVIILYGIAWLRGNRLGEVGLAVLLIASSMIGPATVDVASFRFPAVVPLTCATALLTWIALLSTASSFRWFLAVAGAIATSTVALWESASALLYAAAAVHLLLGTVLLLAIAFDDRFARLCRQLGPMLFLLLGLAAVPILAEPESARIAGIGYALALAIGSWFCWVEWRGTFQLVLAIFTTCVWLVQPSLFVAAAIKHSRNPIAAVALVGGTASFLVALAISFGKAGLWQRWCGPVRRAIGEDY